MDYNKVMITKRKKKTKGEKWEEKKIYRNSEQACGSTVGNSPSYVRFDLRPSLTLHICGP